MIALVAFLHVCLYLGAATTPHEICNGYGCMVRVPAASHFGGFNHCNADSDGTLIKSAGCNMWWCSNVYRRHDDDKDVESFKYGMGSDGNPKAWCVGCFCECSEARIALGRSADANIVTNYISDDGGEGPKAGVLLPAKKS